MGLAVVAVLALDGGVGYLLVDDAAPIGVEATRPVGAGGRALAAPSMQ
jgi:hypothetical protein